MQTEPAFECSADGCSAPTAGHYCEAHGAECVECGDEYEVAALNDYGVCKPCERSAGTYVDGDECRDGIRSGVEYAPPMVRQ